MMMITNEQYQNNNILYQTNKQERINDGMCLAITLYQSTGNVNLEEFADFVNQMVSLKKSQIVIPHFHFVFSSDEQFKIVTLMF